jgi:hypothetical protein
VGKNPPPLQVLRNGCCEEVSDELLPKCSGVYFYDADKKQFIRQIPRTPTPIILGRTPQSPTKAPECRESDFNMDNVHEILQSLPPRGPLTMQQDCGIPCDPRDQCYETITYPPQIKNPTQNIRKEETQRQQPLEPRRPQKVRSQPQEVSNGTKSSNSYKDSSKSRIGTESGTSRERLGKRDIGQEEESGRRNSGSGGANDRNTAQSLERDSQIQFNETSNSRPNFKSLPQGQQHHASSSPSIQLELPKSSLGTGSEEQFKDKHSGSNHSDRGTKIQITSSVSAVIKQ